MKRFARIAAFAAIMCVVFSFDADALGIVDEGNRP